MTLPIWLASIIAVYLFGSAAYLVKLVLDHDRRIEHLEAKLNGRPKHD